jgi:arylamine N-acetyltransferase
MSLHMKEIDGKEEMKESLMAKPGQTFNNSPKSHQTIEVERGGCCYNLNEMFSYRAPT